MNSEKIILGFSRFNREEKIRIAAGYASKPLEFKREMEAHWHAGNKMQKNDEFTENAVSNYYLPYSLAPNFRINGKDYVIPMVTEESSVVAAAASAAKFWWPLGGFKTKIHGMLKPGHIHFLWKGNAQAIEAFMREIMDGMYESAATLVKEMRARGGGIESIKLVSSDKSLEGYYKVEVLFNTVDAMGANFINSCLEAMAGHMIEQAEIRGMSDHLEIIMSILSNYTPQCLVECKVSCNISDLDESKIDLNRHAFARRFETAVIMAQHDVSRAVTHNKGIFNGIDAVIMATGNDFRAVEADGHAWACRDGTYRGLTRISLQDGQFELILEMPMPVGVVGGVTKLHPLAKASLQLLGNPGADKLMSVAAAAGMANHFSAIKALITNGIQGGHMKLHLINILKQLNADQDEQEKAIQYFKKRKITHSGVREFLSLLREK